MAWRTISVNDQINLFIDAWLENKFSVQDLCRQFGITRQCAYKWINRYKEEGRVGLKQHSRRPHNSPIATSSSIEEAILEIKYKWPKHGPKKILGHLNNNFNDINWPSQTTIENILKRHGLVKKRKTRKRLAQATGLLEEPNFSNDLWSMDFKGWWLTNDEKKIEPFTLMDSYSRFLLCHQKLHFNNVGHTWAVFERLFREYGLPFRIRSDNGPPFATLGAGRLSKLSINFIKAGIIPEWIEPGEPQQNGRHERMHLTLKQNGIDLSLSLNDQIKKLEDFAYYYNFERPHEALGQKTPSQIYRPSERYWDGLLRSPEYSKDYKIGKVKSCGKMSWKGGEIYIGRAFDGEPIGLKVDEENVKAYYGPIFLGVVKGNSLEIERRPGRKIKNLTKQPSPRGGLALLTL